MLLNLNRSLIRFAIDDAMDFLKPTRRLCVLLLNMATANYAMTINTVSMISTPQRLSWSNCKFIFSSVNTKGFKQLGFFFEEGSSGSL